MDAGNKRIARNTFYLYVRMIFVLLITLYTSRVVLNMLGVVDYGIYNVIAGFVSMFSFLNTSLTGAIQRFYNYEGAQRGDQGRQEVFETSFYIQVVLSLIVVLALETFGLWYINNVMVIPPERLQTGVLLFHFSVISLVVVMMQVPYSSAIMSFERFDFYALVGIIDVLLKLVIVLILPSTDVDKLPAYGFLLLLITIIDFILYFVYAIINFKELKFKRFFNKGLFKSMMVFSGWNFFGTFTNIFYTQGVSLVLNFFYGPILNAARGVAHQVMSALHGFSLNIVTAFRPQLVESYAEGNYKKTKDVMFNEAKFSYLMVLLLIIPLVLEIRYILAIWLGREAVPEYTEEFTVLILLNMLMSSCNAPFTQVTHATGKMKNFHLITGLITSLNVPFSYISLKMGAAPTSVFIIAIILTVVSQFACMLVVRTYFAYGIMNYIKRVITPCAFVTLVAPLLPLVIRMTMDESFIRLLLVFIISVLTTVCCAYYMALNRNDRVLVKTKVLAIVKKYNGR